MHCPKGCGMVYLGFGICLGRWWGPSCPDGVVYLGFGMCLGRPPPLVSGEVVGTKVCGPRVYLGFGMCLGRWWRARSAGWFT